MMQLSPFASVLFGKYDEYFEELKNIKEKPITDDDYAPYELEDVSWGGERSPKSIEELKKFVRQRTPIVLEQMGKWSSTILMNGG